MTEETLVIVIVTAVVFLLDLLVSVVKASFSHAKLPHLLNLRETRGEVVDRTIQVIE